MDYIIQHHGIKGQRWGHRRFQNEDGSLTPEGRERYGVDDINEQEMTDDDWDRYYRKEAEEHRKRVKKYILMTAALSVGAVCTVTAISKGKARAAEKAAMTAKQLEEQAIKARKKTMTKAVTAANKARKKKLNAITKSAKKTVNKNNRDAIKSYLKTEKYLNRNGGGSTKDAIKKNVKDIKKAAKANYAANVKVTADILRKKKK